MTRSPQRWAFAVRGRLPRSLARPRPPRTTAAARPGIGEKLAVMSAPEGFRRYAGAFADFGSCWDACPAVDWLLWAAARLARTDLERRAVVACTVGLARQALGHAGLDDRRATDAISAAQAWAAHLNGADVARAAERGALNAAADAAERAAEEAARARRLFAVAPRRRPSAAMAGRAMTAQLASAAAVRQMRAALAAAWAARCAAAADAAADSPREWAAVAAQAGAHAVSALTSAPATRTGKSRLRAAAHYADLVRCQLPCPQMASEPATAATARRARPVGEVR